MTAERFDKLFSGLRDRRPFEVFTVELHGGHRFEIDHPMALIVRDGVAVFLGPGGRPEWFDHEGVVRVVGAPAHELKDGENGEADENLTP